MKATLSLIESLIREELIQKQLDKIDQLEAAGGKIQMVVDNSSIQLIYTKNSRNIEGALVAVKEKKNCLNSFSVSFVSATKGFGPLLYEVAIEFLSRYGIPLTSDRVSVSDDARKVWSTFQKRADVEAHQLDDLIGTLTPDNVSDDCKQASAVKDGNWQDSPQSKTYKKNQKDRPLLKRLISKDMLEYSRQ